MVSALLDTNIVVAYLAGDESVKAKVAATSIVISAVVLGELDFGAKKSGRPQQNLERIENLIAALTVVAVDARTAQVFGDIKTALKGKGRPIPDNDIWIAASAIQHGFVLATRDAHFAEVDGLRIEKW